jgi:hypothetical protein
MKNLGQLTHHHIKSFSKIIVLSYAKAAMQAIIYTPANIRVNRNPPLRSTPPKAYTKITSHCEIAGNEWADFLEKGKRNHSKHHQKRKRSTFRKEK